jgi:hypothetical protein
MENTKQNTARVARLRLPPLNRSAKNEESENSSMAVPSPCLLSSCSLLLSRSSYRFLRGHGRKRDEFFICRIELLFCRFRSDLRSFSLPRMARSEATIAPWIETVGVAAIQTTAEQAGDGQARSRLELIDIPDLNPYPPIEVALPDRAAMPLRSPQKTPLDESWSDDFPTLSRTNFDRCVLPSRISFAGRVGIRPRTGAPVDTDRHSRLLGRGDTHHIAAAAAAHEAGFDFSAIRIRDHPTAHDPPDESRLVLEGAMTPAFCLVHDTHDHPKPTGEHAGDGQARSRRQLIDFTSSNPYLPIEAALPDRAAMPQTFAMKLKSSKILVWLAVAAATTLTGCSTAIYKNAKYADLLKRGTSRVEIQEKLGEPVKSGELDSNDPEAVRFLARRFDDFIVRGPVFDYHRYSGNGASLFSVEPRAGRGWDLAGLMPA